MRLSGLESAVENVMQLIELDHCNCVFCWIGFVSGIGKFIGRGKYGSSSPS